MKKFLRITLIVFSVIIFLAAALITYVKVALPNVGAAPDLKIEATPARIKRGKYLANSVAACMDCHSQRKWSEYAGPMVKGTEGQGGEAFTHLYGFPGDFYSKNITPFGIGNWTDGELYRAIAMGVSKDGKPLFPVMPYLNYGKMTNEDIYSIIAYLRTLPSIENAVPERSIDFPVSIIIHTIPATNTPEAAIPAKSDTVEYGRYLLNAASCGECHTKQENGQKIAGMDLAGGFEFPMGAGVVVRSSNITPDNETGIGGWTKEQFIRRFKTYSDSTYTPANIKPGQFNTVMPWMMYANMSEEDLGAIYAYLRTVKSIPNEVEKVTFGK